MAKKIKAVAYSVIAATTALLLAFAPTASAADMIDVSSWQTGINVTTTGAQIVVAKALKVSDTSTPIVTAWCRTP